MPEDKEDGRQVTVQAFVEEISGSTGFTYDKIVSQLARSHDDGQDFLCHHGDALYRVPLASINEFFASHEKPLPKMSAEQEVLYLRKKLMEADKTIEELTGIEKDSPKGATRQDILGGTATKEDLQGMFDSKQINRTPDKPKPETIFEPPAHVQEQKVERLDEIQSMIKEQVKDKQPVKPREAVESGQVREAVRSPRAPETESPV